IRAAERACSSSYCGHYCDLHSFPTRRSSDLQASDGPDPEEHRELPPAAGANGLDGRLAPHAVDYGSGLLQMDAVGLPAAAQAGRSEEHTSELQSRSDLVCCLLLEQKNLFVRM